MREITVEKAKLIAILKENRDKHVTNYKLALKGYKEDLIESYQEKLSVLKKTKKQDEVENFNPHINLPTPVSHEDNYNQIIEMLELDVTETVVLNWNEYNQYVKDVWGWAHDSVTNDSYAKRYL